MSRSIYKTIKQVYENNNKWDLKEKVYVHNQSAVRN